MAIVFLFGANSFDPKALSTTLAEQLWNIGNKSAFALIIQSYQVSSLVVLQINQVSYRWFSWRYVSNFWWFWIYRWYYCGFLAGYLTQGIKYITRGLPQAVEGLKPTLIYPLLSVTITGLLMIYAFNPPDMVK